MPRIPHVLIASASILIDRITKNNVVVERLKCQILLWLTLAVSRNDHSESQDATAADHEEVFQAWLYVVFFCNIVSIVIDDGRERNLEFTSWIQEQHLPLDLLSASAWVTLMAFTIESGSSSSTNHGTHHESIMWTLKVFMISLGVFWALKWYWRRKATIAQDIPIIPGILASNQTMPPGIGIGIELSRWYEWNVKQTWTWISGIVESNNNTDDAKAVLRLLAPHMLQGNALDTLTVQHLVQLINLPYGPAVNLFQEIDSLKQLYPKPNSAGVGFDKSSLSHVQRPMDWLAMHDQEYNTWTVPDISRDYAESSASRARHNHIPSIDPIQEERLSQIMKERYGIQLPTVQLSIPTMDDNISNLAGVTQSEPTRSANGALQAYGGQQTTRLPSNQSQNYSMHQGQSVHFSESSHLGDSRVLPVQPSLLDQMPPRIREIAERRPDLVHQLLSQKSSRISSTTNQNDRQTSRKSDANHVDEEGGGSDDEMARLIQRKPRG